MGLSPQRALILLSAMIGSAVAWAGCGSTIIGPGSGGSSSTDSSSVTGSSSTSGSSSSSGTVVCNGGPDCFDGLPSQGSPCTTPGECCEFFSCDHMGGNNVMTATCVDAGTWEWQ